MLIYDCTVTDFIKYKYRLVYSRKIIGETF